MKRHRLATTLADDLIAEALACPCDVQGECCVRCDCLVELIRVIDLWQADLIARMPWLEPPPPPLSRLSRLGYAVLAYGVVAACLLHFAWEMSVLQWHHWRGRGPRYD